MRRVRSQFLQLVQSRLGRGVAAVMACLCVSGAFAGSAGASIGPFSTWGNQPGQGVSRTDGGGFNQIGAASLAVNDSTGDVYAVDRANNRVQRFTSSGEFISAWGFDVVQSGQILAGDLGTNVFEKCTVAAACKAGINTVVASAGVGTGGEFSTPWGIAVDQATGDVYVMDSAFARVQEFTASGDFVRAFGQDVVFGSGGENNPAAPSKQTATIDATGGQYRLTFKGQTTGDIDFNAPATGAGSVQAALQVLSTIGAGNATVVGPAGGPYTVTFAGTLTNSRQPLITTSAGTIPLSGGTGTATVAYTTPPSPGNPGTAGSTGFEVCTDRATCKTGIAGASNGAFGQGQSGIATAGNGIAVAPSGAPNAGNILVTDPGNFRVQEFAANGEFVRAWGFNVAKPWADEQQTVTVAGTGSFTLTFDPDGAGPLPGETTAPMPHNSNGPQNMTSALEQLPSIAPGEVSVAGTATAPKVVTFTENLGGSDRAQLTSNPAEWTGTVSVSVVTNVNGFGGRTFEVCRAASFDICQRGAKGSNAGQFGGPGTGFTTTSPNRIAEDSAGNIYTVESLSNFRVQKFSLPSNQVTPQGAYDPSELSGTSSSNAPKEIAIDGARNLYVVKQDVLLRVDPSAGGGTGQVAESLLANSGSYVLEGKIDRLAGVAVRASGRPLYVSSPARVFRLDEVSGLSASVTASEVGASSAVLKASVTPAAIPLTTRYRFEYSKDGVNWEVSPIPDADLGNGSGDGDPATCPISNPATCELEFELPDLDIDTTYSYRVVAASMWHGAEVVTPTQTFTTQATLPTVRTGVAGWSSPASTDPSLVLRGEVNPQATRTTYRFEYLPDDEFAETGWEHAAKVPVLSGEAGHGTIARELVEVVNGLDPAETYRYRLLATNASGISTGAERTVSPPSDGDRFLELVSEGDGAGVGLTTTRPLVISDDGERAAFGAQVFGDPSGLPHHANRFVAERDGSGWSVAPNGAGADSDGATLTSGYLWLSADLRRLLWRAPSQGQVARGELQWRFGDLDGGLSPVGPLISPISMTVSGASLETYDFQGGASDLSTIVFSQPRNRTVTLLAGETPVPGTDDGQSNLYRLSGLGGQSSALSLLNRAPDGSQVGGACGARLGELNLDGRRVRSVSEDGQVVYFSARPGAPATGACNTAFPVRLYKRVGDSSTVAVSQSQCTRTAGDPGGVCSSVDGDDSYWGASMDGSRVFFTSPRQLTNSDRDTTTDLYVYDADPPAGEPNLAQVSAGEVTPDHPTIGAAANVLGVSDVAADGSRVYFAAKGRLTADAALDANNLYVYQRDADHPAGRIALVAELTPGIAQTIGSVSQDDSDLWVFDAQHAGRPVLALPFYEGLGESRVAGDGRYLLFIAQRALVAGDEDSIDDLYRYDDETGDLVCLSCAGDSEAYPVNSLVRRLGVSSAYVQESRYASEDVSSVIFATREPLTDDDENTSMDVYAWHEDGELELVSRAVGRRGVSGFVQEGFDQVTLAPAISADGRSVFFSTRASLVPQDRNNLRPDYYVARVGGGFKLPDTSRGCDTLGDACQGDGAEGADARRNTTSGGGNSAAGDRLVLSVKAPDAAGRRRAAKTGIVALRVRSSQAGVVRVAARGRVGGRIRQLGSAAKQFAGPGSAVMAIRLSRAARRALTDGRRLRLSLAVRSEGARPRTLSVLLRRAGK